MFTAIKSWLHRLFGKTEEKAVQPVRTKKKLSRADRKQIEAAIARANRTDKKEKSAQDSIPYERMWPDGICRVADGHYTKTIQFQDINYQLSQNEDKTAIFEGWCDFLNYFDSSIKFELSFLNLAASKETFARAISIPLQGDDFDSIRVEYMTMLQNQLAKGNNGLIKTKYLTFGIDADSIKSAKPRLERIETDILNNFKRLGVAAETLDGIAVNDRYDSSSSDNAHDGIIIPLRNMINEAYAMDIARKIKAQQRQAMKDGKYVGGRTPYGYLKAPDNCHQLIVDPVAAEVVKTMFQWAAEGAGLNTIAVRLNEAGYLSPSHYKRTLGEITHENLVGNGHWQTRTVAKILRAEVYTGDLVQGVSKIIDHKQVRASADEWTTVRGTHEAIISRELFAAVQKALDQAAQQAKDREIHSWSPNLLRGKIFCAHCGHSLHRQKCVRRKSQEVYVYHCISNNRIKKGVCPGVFIFEKELLDALADVIQEQLDTTLGQYSLGLENLSKEAEEQKNIQAKIASRKQEIQQLRTYQRGLYEGLIQNHLSKDEYFSFKEKYEAKIEAISEEIEQLKAGLAILAKQLEQYKMLSQDAQHIKEDRQLTAALIDRLIDRIEVSREKRITVRFRFQSEFEHCEEVLSQCRNM